MNITSALSSLQNYLPSESSMQTAVICTVVALVGAVAFNCFQNAEQAQDANNVQLSEFSDYKTFTKENGSAIPEKKFNDLRGVVMEAINS